MYINSSGAKAIQWVSFAQFFRDKQIYINYINKEGDPVKYICPVWSQADPYQLGATDKCQWTSVDASDDEANMLCLFCVLTLPKSIQWPYMYIIYIYTKNTGEKKSVHMMQVQIDDISLMEALNNHVAAEEAVTARVVDVKEEVEPGDDKELPLSRPIPSPARSRAQGSKPASSLKGARPRTRQEPCKPNQSSYKPVYIACLHACNYTSI